MRQKNRSMWLVLIAFFMVMGTISPVFANPSTILFPETGFAVSDTSQGGFFTEFNRLGGVATFGYPISQPFEMQGYVYQVFQRAVLQWQPGKNQAFLANAMDWLSDAGRDDYLSLLGIPGNDRGAMGLDFANAVAERELWLTDDAIALAYRAGGGMDRFGLPTSRPVRTGPFVVQRFQRYVLQRWIEDVPGMPAKGTTVGILAGYYLVQAGIVPKESTRPVEAGSISMFKPIDTGARNTSGRVTAVGDSVMLAAAGELGKTLGDIDIDAVVGRQVAAAIEVLKERRAKDNLGRVVLIHIGNNGTFTAQQFDEMMQLAGTGRKVVFVNNKVPRSWESTNNKVLADGVRRYPNNAVLVDWYGANIGTSNLLWDDGVHLRPEGVRAYVGLLSPVVRSQ